MSYSVNLTAKVSVRLYIPRTVLGEVNRKVTEIVRSNHMTFEGISHSNAVLLPDTQDFYSLESLSIVLRDVSYEFIKEHIPHSLHSLVNDRKYDHYLYWFTKDLEEIGRECDVPRGRVTDTVVIFPQSIPASIVSPKIALTYEDVLMEFSKNAWESENENTQPRIDSYPKLNQRDLREAFLAKKLLEK